MFQTPKTLMYFVILMYKCVFTSRDLNPSVIMPYDLLLVLVIPLDNKLAYKFDFHGMKGIG
jgi:hypothetical protein